MKHLILIAMLMTATKTKTWATETLGTMITRAGDYVILNEDLPEVSSTGLGVVALGLSVDALAVKLGKYEKIPRYRLTRVLRGILLNNRLSQTESADEIVNRVSRRLKADCEEREACAFKIVMRAEDWQKPLPRLQSPASKKDLEIYDDSFIQAFYRSTINDHLQELQKKGRCDVLGQPVYRDIKKGPMSSLEEKELRALFVSTYKSFYLSRRFVTTARGVYWAEDIPTEFRVHPWDDVIIRSPVFPESYDQLVQIIENGLNSYYLSQKREEIFLEAYNLNGGRLRATIEFLLQDVEFIPPAKTLKTNSANAQGAVSNFKNFKADTLTLLDQMIEEKSEAAAFHIVKQSILTSMDRKKSLALDERN